MAIVFLKCSARSCCWLCFWASSFWISTKDLATVISNPFSSSFMSSTALWCSSRDFLTTKTMIVLCAFVQHSTITVMSWSNTSKFSSFPGMALFYVLTDWVNGGIQSWYWTDGGLMLLYSFFFVFLCKWQRLRIITAHTKLPRHFHHDFLLAVVLFSTSRGFGDVLSRPQWVWQDAVPITRFSLVRLDSLGCKPSNYSATFWFETLVRWVKKIIK